VGQVELTDTASLDHSGMLNLHTLVPLAPRLCERESMVLESVVAANGRRLNAALNSYVLEKLQNRDNSIDVKK